MTLAEQLFQQGEQLTVDFQEDPVIVAILEEKRHLQRFSDIAQPFRLYEAPGAYNVKPPRVYVFFDLGPLVASNQSEHVVQDIISAYMRLQYGDGDRQTRAMVADAVFGQFDRETLHKAVVSSPNGFILKESGLTNASIWLDPSNNAYRYIPAVNMVMDQNRHRIHVLGSRPSYDAMTLFERVNQ